MSGAARIAGGVVLALIGAVIVWERLDLGVRLGGGGDSATAAAVAYRPRLTPDLVDHIVAPVRERAERGAFPGAAVAVGVRDLETASVGIGHIGWTRNAPSVHPDSTIYDLASMTKVLATASAVMLLVDEGRLRLDDLVGRFLPEFEEGPKAEVTIRHLLTHTSGLPEGAILRGEDRADRLARAATFPIYPPAGAREEYSDVGFVLLWEIAERAAGEPLQNYLETKLYKPLQMNSTGFLPGLDCERCAPTGRLRDQSLYRGRPFDPIAQRLDGIGGNAGLFSTARDVGRFAAMITSGGELDGVRVLSPAMVREFTRPQEAGRRHGLGWEISCGEPGPPDDDTPHERCDEPSTIGHTGWTGTSLRIDLESGTWVVILTNRTYEPRAPNSLGGVRGEVFRRAVAVGRAESDRTTESVAGSS